MDCIKEIVSVDIYNIIYEYSKTVYLCYDELYHLLPDVYGHPNPHKINYMNRTCFGLMTYIPDLLVHLYSINSECIEIFKPTHKCFASETEHYNEITIENHRKQYQYIYLDGNDYSHSFIYHLYDNKYICLSNKCNNQHQNIIDYYKNYHENIIKYSKVIYVDLKKYSITMGDGGFIVTPFLISVPNDEKLIIMGSSIITVDTNDNIFEHIYYHEGDQCGRYPYYKVNDIHKSGYNKLLILTKK